MNPSKTKNTVIPVKTGIHPRPHCHSGEGRNPSPFSLSLLVLLVLSFFPAFSQDGKSHRVDSWEAAQYSYMDAVRAKDMVIKEYLFREIIGFYKRQEKVNYNPITSCYISLASAYLDIEDFEKLNLLIEEMKKELSEKYKNSAFVLELDEYLQKKETYKKARTLSLELREKYPKLRSSFISGAMLELLEENYSEALKAVEKIKNDVETELIKSYAQLKLDHYPEAIQLSDEVIKLTKSLEPQLSTPHYIKGMALIKQGHPDEGKKEIALARQLNYVNFLCLSNRNDALFKDRLEKEATSIETQLQTQQPATQASSQSIK